MAANKNARANRIFPEIIGPDDEDDATIAQKEILAEAYNLLKHVYVPHRTSNWVELLEEVDKDAHACFHKLAFDVLKLEVSRENFSIDPYIDETEEEYLDVVSRANHITAYIEHIGGDMDFIIAAAPIIEAQGEPRPVITGTMKRPHYRTTIVDVVKMVSMRMGWATAATQRREETLITDLWLYSPDRTVRQRHIEDCRLLSVRLVSFLASLTVSETHLTSCRVSLIVQHEALLSFRQVRFEGDCILSAQSPSGLIRLQDCVQSAGTLHIHTTAFAAKMFRLPTMGQSLFQRCEVLRSGEYPADVVIQDSHIAVCKIADASSAVTIRRTTGKLLAIEVSSARTANIVRVDNSEIADIDIDVEKNPSAPVMVDLRHVNGDTITVTRAAQVSMFSCKSLKVNVDTRTGSDCNVLMMASSLDTPTCTEKTSPVRKRTKPLRIALETSPNTSLVLINAASQSIRIHGLTGKSLIVNTTSPNLTLNFANLDHTEMIIVASQPTVINVHRLSQLGGFIIAVGNVTFSSVEQRLDPEYQVEQAQWRWLVIPTEDLANLDDTSVRAILERAHSVIHYVNMSRKLDRVPDMLKFLRTTEVTADNYIRLVTQPT